MQNQIFQLTGVDLVVPVEGIEGAKAYPLGPNCRAPLFDSKENILYIKSTDANGFPTVKAYDFTERIVIDENSPNAVSLNDIRSLIREELGLIKEDLINAQQPISTNNSTTSNSANVNANSAANKHNSYAAKSPARNNQAKQSGANTPGMEFGEEQRKSSAVVN